MEIDLRFSLREVCALTGVSHQSIRMYEKWGVLPKIAEEDNGYRYYHYPDLQRAVFLRYYASLGVPIKETSVLVNGASVAEMEQVHDAYQREIEGRMAFERAALECLERQRAFLKEIDCFSERCQIVTRPALYQLCCSVDGEVNKSQEAIRLMKEWAALAPVTVFSGISRRDNLGPEGIVDPGYAIYARHAHLLSTLNSPFITYYPPVRAVRAILRVSSRARDFYSMGAFTNAYLEENGLRLCGDVVSISIANKALTRAYPHDPSDYICAWSPVE